MNISCDIASNLLDMHLGQTVKSLEMDEVKGKSYQSQSLWQCPRRIQAANLLPRQVYFDCPKITSAP